MTRPYRLVTRPGAGPRTRSGCRSWSWRRPWNEGRDNRAVSAGVVNEAEAINALNDAKRRLEQSGDKRHIAAAIRDARMSMSNAQIAAELGVSVEWVAEHA